MNIQKIYNKYHIPLNLQKHMLRVAALSQILVDNWKMNKPEKKSIILTCLFHDMANIIKFNFDKPPLFEEEKDRVNYWKSVQKEVIATYGNNIHKVTLKMCQEIGLSNKVLHLVEKLEWNNSLEVIKQNDFESMICIYCDMRIGPYGILSLQDRIQNLQTRNDSYNFDFIRKSAVILEKTVQKYISISVSSITDIQLNEKCEVLLTINV